MNTTFYGNIRFLMFTCRIFGLMPINGLLSPNSEMSRGTYRSVYSLYFAYTWLSLLGSTISQCYVLLYIKEDGKNYDSAGLIFKPLSIVVLVLLMNLTKNWRQILREIEDVERLLPTKYQKTTLLLVNYTIKFLFVFAILEHTVHIIFSLRIMHHQVEFTWEFYLTRTYSWAFDYFPYSPVLGITLQITKLQTGFLFIFIDIFIFAISAYLVLKFKYFNKLILLRQKNCNKNTRWMDLQSYYTRLSGLVKLIDKYFSSFILVSFTWNLLLICRIIYYIIQYLNNAQFLANILSRDWSVPASIFFTFLFLLTKTFVVSATISQVNTLSRKPLDILHTINMSGYSIERLMDQIYHSDVNLTGYQFFRVTRHTILLVVSTVITYELVLLQFNQRTESSF